MTCAFQDEIRELEKLENALYYVCSLSVSYLVFLKCMIWYISIFDISGDDE